MNETSISLKRLNKYNSLFFCVLSFFLSGWLMTIIVIIKLIYEAETKTNWNESIIQQIYKFIWENWISKDFEKVSNTSNCVLGQRETEKTFFNPWSLDTLPDLWR